MQPSEGVAIESHPQPEARQTTTTCGYILCGYCSMLYDRDSMYISGAPFNSSATINIGAL